MIFSFNFFRGPMNPSEMCPRDVKTSTNACFIVTEVGTFSVSRCGGNKSFLPPVLSIPDDSGH